MSRGEHSSASFARLAAELQAEPDPGLTAESIVQRLADLVPDAGPVSLTLRNGKRYTTLAATDDVAASADGLQYELDEGPCLEAAGHASWLRSGDVRRDSRWPIWGPRAADLGIGSLLSVQLLGPEGPGPQGALNIYSKETDDFSDRDVIDQVTVYAVHAANALASAQLADGLTTAMSSRHTIGMAQGIVMERYHLDENQSFALLRRLSATTNTKLRDVAAELVRTRRLPGQPDETEGSAEAAEPS